MAIRAFGVRGVNATSGLPLRPYGKRQEPPRRADLVVRLRDEGMTATGPPASPQWEWAQHAKYRKSGTDG